MMAAALFVVTPSTLIRDPCWCWISQGYMVELRLILIYPKRNVFFKLSRKLSQFVRMDADICIVYLHSWLGVAWWWIQCNNLRYCIESDVASVQGHIAFLDPSAILIMLSVHRNNPCISLTGTDSCDRAKVVLSAILEAVVIKLVCTSLVLRLYETR